MSVPAFGWALERGAALNLLAADRLVLIYLADLANGARVCWPSQETIVRFTGLALRTVRSALRRLEQVQLIRVDAKAGCLPKYHILRDTPANQPHVTPANGTEVAPANQPEVNTPTPANGTEVLSTAPANQHYPPRQIVQLTPANDGQTPANGNTDPSTQERDPRARAHAREEGKVFNLSPLKLARETEPSDEEQEPQREVVCLPSDAKRMLLDSLPALPPEPQPQQRLHHSLREQMAAVSPKSEPKPSYLVGTFLAMARQQARIGVAP